MPIDCLNPIMSDVLMNDLPIDHLDNCLKYLEIVHETKILFCWRFVLHAYMVDMNFVNSCAKVIDYVYMFGFWVCDKRKGLGLGVSFSLVG